MDNIKKSCQKQGSYCTNKDLKRCQLRTIRNVYNGSIVTLCNQCRKDLNGSFKLVPNGEKQN